MTGKTVLITGANKSIGYETVRQLGHLATGFGSAGATAGAEAQECRAEADDNLAAACRVSVRLPGTRQYWQSIGRADTAVGFPDDAPFAQLLSPLFDPEALIVGDVILSLPQPIRIGCVGLLYRPRCGGDG